MIANRSLRSRSPLGLGVLALSTALLGTPAPAHEFWIEPSTFTPPAGAAFGLRLRVGEGFKGEPYGRNPRHIRRFTLHGPGLGRRGRPIGGIPGWDPAGMTAAPSAGAFVALYESRESRVRMEGAKLESYLREEGLEAIARARAREGRSGEAATDVFSRHAKALLSAGEGGGLRAHVRRYGLDLELVPTKSPFALRAGERLGVRLLFRGRPVRGAKVIVVSAAAPGVERSARTDRRGVVRLRLDGRGPFLVAAVHMTSGDEDGEYRSRWASLTFELPAR